MAVPVLLMFPFHEPRMRELEAAYEVHRYWEAPDRDALMASLADRCEIVATTGSSGITAAQMAQLPRLKLVACFGVGVDPIDVPYAKAHGIAVTNTPDVLTDDVADLTLALLLGAVRRIPQGDRFVREGRWLKGPMPLTGSLQGAKVGIVGMGRIGQAIAKRCAAFNTEIAWNGPRAKPEVAYPYHADLVSLATWADILIAACPGGPATRGLVSRPVMEALGPQGLLVNIARGSVVDQPAMIELLKSGALGGAALDVFDGEPAVPAELMAMDNVVLHPHQGSATHATRMAMGGLVLQNIAAFVAGKPLITPV